MSNFCRVVLNAHITLRDPTLKYGLLPIKEIITLDDT